ncbi:hypothetical protein PEX1_091790 [Penicillium expansum]|nr:hypothetical protein PEX1_091790 [Penicillium expansum]
MSDRDPPTREPDPARAPGVAQGGTSMPLAPYTALQHDIGQAYSKYVAYSQVIANGGYLAPQIGNLIFYNEVEKTAARIFGQAPPRMVEYNAYRPIVWTDVLLQSLTADDFDRQESGMYWCRVWGTLIEVSEANYIAILSDIPQQLLQPFRNLSDGQKETRVRFLLRSYLRETYNNLFQFSVAIGASIRALDGPHPIQASVYHTNPVYTGPNQTEPPNPNSAQRPNSAKSVVIISDAEGDRDEHTQDNINVQASEWGLLGDSTSDEDHVPSAHALASNSTGSESTTDYHSSSSENRPRNTRITSDDEASIDVVRGNPGNPVNDDNAHTGFVTYRLFLGNSQASSHNANAGLVDNNIPSATNNHMVGTVDANGNIQENAHANDNSRPSGLTSGVTSRSIYPWLMNIETPVSEDFYAQSSDTDTSHEFKVEPASSDEGPYGVEPYDEESDEEESDDEKRGDEEPHDEASPSTDTTTEGHGMRTHGSKRPQTETPPSESEIKPRTCVRYSQLEEAEGPEFVRCLVSKGSTCAEIEEEYSEKFGLFRSAAGLFKKFAIKGTWSILKHHEQAKRQKTMPA